MTERERSKRQNEQNEQPEESRALPPEARTRPDAFVRAVSPEARKHLQGEGDGIDATMDRGWKGRGGQTADRTGLPYTVEEYDQYLEEAPKGLMTNAPGTGTLKLSPEREPFLESMAQIGRFETTEEAERWTRAVFDALRVRTIDTDVMRESKMFDDVVNTSETPEVQVKNMMWQGDFLKRHLWLMSHLKGWSKQEFYDQVANYGHTTPDDAWVAAAIYAYFGAIKRMSNEDPGDLGELQDVWNQA